MWRIDGKINRRMSSSTGWMRPLLFTGFEYFFIFLVNILNGNSLHCSIASRSVSIVLDNWTQLLDSTLTSAWQWYCITPPSMAVTPASSPASFLIGNKVWCDEQRAGSCCHGWPFLQAPELHSIGELKHKWPSFDIIALPEKRKCSDCSFCRQFPIRFSQDERK